MSSIRRHIVLTPACVRYFLAVQGYTPPEPIGFVDYTDAALTFANGYPGSVIQEESIRANYVAFQVVSS